MRHSTLYIAVTGCGLLLLASMALHARYARGHEQCGHAIRRQLVRELQLTDLCLVTEARYTRHLAMADLHAPFQDHPLSLEHFPSGAVLAPPQLLTRPHVPRP